MQKLIGVPRQGSADEEKRPVLCLLNGQLQRQGTAAGLERHPGLHVILKRQPSQRSAVCNIQKLVCIGRVQLARQLSAHVVRQIVFLKRREPSLEAYVHQQKP